MDKLGPVSGLAAIGGEIDGNRVPAIGRISLGAPAGTPPPQTAPSLGPSMPPHLPAYPSFGHFPCTSHFNPTLCFPPGASRFGPSTVGSTSPTSRANASSISTGSLARPEQHRWDPPRPRIQSKGKALADQSGGRGHRRQEEQGTARGGAPRVTI